MLWVYHRTRLGDGDETARHVRELKRLGDLRMETAVDGAPFRVLPVILSRVGPDDAIVLWSIERLGRNLPDLICNARRVLDAGAVLYLAGHEPPVRLSAGDGATPSLLLELLDDARSAYKGDAARRGAANARSRGSRVGRPAKLSDDDVTEAVRLLDEGYELNELADRYGVHKETLRRRVTAIRRAAGPGIRGSRIP